MSFPRMRESHSSANQEIPAYTGMTVSSSVSFPRLRESPSVTTS
ncbi:MAG: hypothetical protein NT007_08635 [Candidatus Kapabacteria bacterium]|nr:hypothetical protein [Candidatus Kapabacteria bacterium]